MTTICLTTYKFHNDDANNFASYATYVHDTDFAVNTEMDYIKGTKILNEMSKKFNTPIEIRQYEDFTARGVRVNLPEGRNTVLDVKHLT